MNTGLQLKRLLNLKIFNSYKGDIEKDLKYGDGSVDILGCGNPVNSRLASDGCRAESNRIPDSYVSLLGFLTTRPDRGLK